MSVEVATYDTGLEGAVGEVRRRIVWVEDSWRLKAYCRPIEAGVRSRVQGI
jgi:hypothetical protein